MTFSTLHRSYRYHNIQVPPPPQQTALHPPSKTTAEMEVRSRNGGSRYPHLCPSYHIPTQLLPRDRLCHLTFILTRPAAAVQRSPVYLHRLPRPICLFRRPSIPTYRHPQHLPPHLFSNSSPLSHHSYITLCFAFHQWYLTPTPTTPPPPSTNYPTQTLATGSLLRLNFHPPRRSLT